MSTTFPITPRGPFELASAARFIAGWPPAGRTGRVDGIVRLAFLTDDFTGDAGVVLRQGSDGAVAGEMVDATARDLDAVRDQAARIVSLDHDGTGYARLGEADEVLGALQRASGWLRPVLFHSPYEAACWSIISLRLRQAQAAAIRDRLSEGHGRAIEVDGERLLAFPAPDRLLQLSEIAGLTEEKVARLHGVANAALEGRLDRARLLAMDHEEALDELCALRGIGPFWSQLILLRAVGPTDAIALGEPRMRAAAATAYGRPELADDDAAFLALAETWRPWRTWVSVLLRATA